MQKFLRLLVLFLFPIVSIGITMEFLIRNIPNDYTYKKKYLDEKSNEIEVLFLGSSHAYYGINPIYCKRKSFNASNISQSLNYDLEILKKYDNRFGNLKYIIVPVDYFSMYASLETGLEKWRVKNYTIYYGINPDHNYRSNSEVLSIKLSRNLSRLYRYQFRHKSNLMCNSLGWGTRYTSRYNKDLVETGKTAALRHTKISRKECFARNRKYIEDIIAFAKRHNAKLIFITSPAYKTYVEYLESTQLNTTLGFIKQAALQSNSAYFNLLNDKSFIAKDFYDADHLNELGAQKLTLKLDSILDKEEEKIGHYISK